MFNLEQEVDAWCRAVLKNGCGQQERMEELQDHLYCEIDRLRDKGFSEEQAFLKATQRLGTAEELSAEFAKNNGILATLCAIEQTHDEILIDEGLSPQQNARLLMTHSLLFAGAMLLTPLLIADSDAATTILFAILIPLWFATYLLLPGTRHLARYEWQYLRRIFGLSR